MTDEEQAVLRLGQIVDAYVQLRQEVSTKITRLPESENGVVTFLTQSDDGIQACVSHTDGREYDIMIHQRHK